MKTPATNIKKLREDRGLGVRELARAIGISPAFLSKIESGKKKPGRLILLSILDYLGASDSTEDPNHLGELFEKTVAETLQNLLKDKGVTIDKVSELPDFSLTLPSGRGVHISVKYSDAAAKKRPIS